MAGLADFGKATSPESLDYLAKANQASAPGLAIFQQSMAAPMMDQRATEQAAQKQSLVKQLAAQVQQRDYAGAASTYSMLDPEGAKTLLPQLMQADPSLQGQIEGSKEGAKLGAQSPFGANNRQITDANNANAIKLKQMELDAAAAKEKAAPKPTAGQEAYDKKIADIVSDWEQAGGASYEEHLKSLKEAKDLLAADKPAVTGKIQGVIRGLTPDAIGDALFPNTAKVKDVVKAVVMPTLRPILGSQFTKEEGERVINNTFNDRLSPKENLKRLEEIGRAHV